MAMIQMFLHLLAEMHTVNTSSLKLSCPLLYMTSFFLGSVLALSAFVVHFLALFCFPFVHCSWLLAYLISFWSIIPVILALYWIYVYDDIPQTPQTQPSPYQTCFLLLVTILILGIIFSYKSKLETSLPSLTSRIFWSSVSS